MKRLIALFMALSLMFCVCGCSKDKDENTTKDEAVVTETNSSEEDTTTPKYETVSSEETVDIEPLSEPVMVPDFTPINQNPELPTGCEITSLAMVLRYYGYDVDKCDLADNHLKKGEVGSTSFYEAFVGSPYGANDGSLGCYAPVIEDAANSYISYMGLDMSAKALQGVSFSTLLSYIDVGIPVIVWGTLNCEQGYESASWTVDGEELTWIRPEHCMVLVGYDNNLVYIADPMQGEIVTYDMELFIDCFRTLYSQAVVIE